MTSAGRHSQNKCPHCGGSPRYGLEKHIMWCPKRPAQPIFPIEGGGYGVVLPTPSADELMKVLKKGVCPKCDKYIGRGLHMHQKACKGGGG